MYILPTAPSTVLQAPHHAAVDVRMKTAKICSCNTMTPLFKTLSLPFWWVGRFYNSNTERYSAIFGIYTTIMDKDMEIITSVPEKSDHHEPNPHSRSSSGKYVFEVLYIPSSLPPPSPKTKHLQIYLSQSNPFPALHIPPRNHRIRNHPPSRLGGLRTDISVCVVEWGPGGCGLWECDCWCWVGGCCGSFGGDGFDVSWVGG